MPRHALTALALASALPLALAACTTVTEQTGPSQSGGPSAASAAPVVAKSDQAAALVPKDFQSKGQIVFAHDASYPPFEYFDKDNTTIIGFDADVADAIAAKLGLKAKHVNTGFDTILPGLTSGKHDVGMSAFTITPERAKTVDFVVYLSGGTAIAVPQGNPQKLSMDPMSLCGHKLSAQKGSIQGMEQLPAIDKQCRSAGKDPVGIQLYPSQNDANLALTAGRVDAIAADSTSLGYQGKLANGSFELAPGQDYEPAPFGVALTKGSPLVPAVAEAIKELGADGTLKKLGATWSLPEQVFDTDLGKVVK